MNKKNIIIMSCVTLLLISLAGVTYAAFRKGVRSNVTATGGEIKLLVNDTDVIKNEVFEVVLQRSETQQFIIPGDEGSFDLVLDSAGSHVDIKVDVTISTEGLPDNLKFYMDESHRDQYTTKSYKMEKDSTKTVKVYWYWADIDDENDNLFIGKTITVNVTVSAATTTINPAIADTFITNATLDTDVDFGLPASETNGQGLMLMDSTKDDDYPIAYYRGDVANNNVIFANKCWLIVRTTETGGLKLIYNGEAINGSKCTNYSGVGGEDADSNYENALINKTTYVFNDVGDLVSPVYVGYMYNDINSYFNVDSRELDVDGYIEHLADNTIDSKTGNHSQNLKDSTVKTVIDAWYETNIVNTGNDIFLEDTVWCNDRSVISENFSIENYENNDFFFYYSAGSRLDDPFWDEEFYPITPVEPIMPSLSCVRNVDKFTVDRNTGNGDLTYPIGMLTADELFLTGNTYSDGMSYLVLPDWQYWTLSPVDFFDGYCDMFIMDDVALDFFASNDGFAGIRPSISLSPDAEIAYGNGSFQAPYRIYDTIPPS